MSDSKQSAGRVVIGEGSHDSRLRLSPQTLRIVLPLAIVLVLVVSGLLLNRFVLNPPLSDTQQDAVSKASASAKGFDQKDKGYALTELNTAVKYAINKQCVEARAVYDEVHNHPSGVSALDLKAYKTKIDTLCSAK